MVNKLLVHFEPKRCITVVKKSEKGRPTWLNECQIMEHYFRTANVVSQKIFPPIVNVGVMVHF